MLLGSLFLLIAGAGGLSADARIESGKVISRKEKQ